MAEHEDEGDDLMNQMGGYMEVNEEPERAESKESLQQEIERLREQLTLLAQRGGQVIVELTSKLEAKDEKIVQLEGTIRKLNSTIELSV